MRPIRLLVILYRVRFERWRAERATGRARYTTSTQLILFSRPSRDGT